MIKKLFTISLGVDDAAATRLHLRGRIVTPTDDIADGTIVVENGVIQAVHPKPVKPTGGAIEHETRGTMLAGFVDSHNHPECAAVRRWVCGPRFDTRTGWRGANRCQEPAGAPKKDPFYEFGPYRELRLLAPTPVAAITGHAIRYGQIRAVVGGATAVVLDANAQTPPLPPSSINRGAGSDVMTILDPGCIQPVAGTAPPDGVPDVATVAQHLANGGRVHAHCAEGKLGDAHCQREFDVLDHNGLLGPRTSLIHGIGLDVARLQRVQTTGTSMIWSPVSNMNLYAYTLDAQRVIDMGIPLALAPDWTVSGSSTILDEARLALSTYPWLRPTQALRMITEIPASLLGLSTGKLSPGLAADIVVFDGPRPKGTLDDVVRDLLTRPHEAISLVIANGTPVYGTPTAMAAVGATPRTTILVPTDTGWPVEREIALTQAMLDQTISEIRAVLQRDPAPYWEKA